MSVKKINRHCLIRVAIPHRKNPLRRDNFIIFQKLKQGQKNTAQSDGVFFSYEREERKKLYLQIFTKSSISAFKIKSDVF